MNDSLYQAVLTLAGKCDGAYLKDRMGFNKIDAPFGHKLADTPFENWSPRQKWGIWKRIQKYKEQLLSSGIRYEDIIEPVVTEQEKGNRWILFAKDQKILEIHFPYNLKIVAAVKELPSRRFNDDGQRKYWSILVAPDIIPKVLEFAAKYEFELGEGVEETLETYTLYTQNLLASEASTSDFTVEGLGGTLLPFQRAGVEYAVRAKRCIIGEEMGLGKTVEALAAIQHLNAFPVLVICPASAKLNWAKEIAQWLPALVQEDRVNAGVMSSNRKKPFSVRLKDGRKIEVPANDISAKIVIINYDLLSRDLNEKGLTGRTLTLSKIPFKSLIVDEFQKIKNYKAQRTKAVRKLATTREYCFMLSGTSILNRPAELLSPLGVLGRLEELGGFWGFAKRYIGAVQTRWGWDFSGAKHLEELNQRLRGICYIRRKKSEVLPELPPKRRVTVPVELTNREEYETAESDIVSWIAKQATEDEEFLAEIEREIGHLRESNPDEYKRQRTQAIFRKEQNARYKAKQNEHLVRIEALKQLCANGKLEAVTEWIESFLESGEKLVVFADHIKIQKTLLEKFPQAASLFGEYNDKTRQDNIDRLQTDPECKLFIGSFKAAGEAITLTAASNVAFVEFGWTPAGHDQAEDRCHRIGQQDSVTCWYLVGENTIDEDIIRLVERKREIVEQTLDGDEKERGKHQSILKGLIKRLKQRG